MKKPVAGAYLCDDGTAIRGSEDEKVLILKS